MGSLTATPPANLPGPGSATIGSNWVAQMRQTSWYPTVKATMDQYGVPEWVWLGVIADESGGNPGNAGLDTGNITSFGLFQLYGNSRGLDPAYAAQWAAPKLAAAYNAGGGSQGTIANILWYTEQAAWPSLGYPNDHGPGQASEWPSRYADMLATYQQSQGLGAVQTTSNNSTTGTTAAPATPSTSGGSMPQSSNWLTGFESWGQNLSNEIFVGGVVLALIAGGFVLLGSD